ncbi:MAG: peptide ABC transporter substrate-binding protein [Oscillospiraceae bacterium]
MEWKNKAISIALVVTMLVGSLSGCSTKTKDGSETANFTGKSITWHLSSESSTLDPQLSSSFETHKVLGHLFEGLYRVKDIGAEKALVESEEISKDGLIYTFKLKDAKWSDGQPVKAQDFEFAWKRAVSPEIENQGVNSFDVIENAEDILNKKKKPETLGVKALDDKTLQVKLVKPSQGFICMLASPAFGPLRKDIVDSEGKWANDEKTIVSNGPFVLKKCALNEEIVLEKNPYYYDKDKVKIDRLIFKVMTSLDSAYTAYKQGKIDAISDVTENIAKDAINTGEYHTEPSLDTYMLIFNFSNPVLKDKKVRRALSLAIDREKLVKDVLGKTGERATATYIPFGFLNSKGEEIRNIIGEYGRSTSDGDFAEARALLAEAGYPEGKNMPKIELLCNDSTANKKIMSYLQEEWKKNLGVKVDISVREWNTYETLLNERSFPGMCRVRWGVDYPDVLEPIEIFKDNPKCKNPKAEYHNKEYNDLVTIIKTTLGDERDTAIYKAEKMIEDDSVCIPLFFGTNSLLVKSNITGWHLNCMGLVYFGDADVKQ